MVRRRLLDPCLRSIPVWLALSGGPEALAQPDTSEPRAPEQVELEYSSGESCPDKSSFRSEVAARIRRPVTWVVADGGVHIAIALSQTPQGATGRLEVSRGGATPTRREFTAATCGEVGSALALVVALALDPNARTEPLPPFEPAPPEEAPPEPSPVDQPVPLPPAPTVSVSRPAMAAPPATAPPPVDYVAWLGPVAGVSAGYAPEALVTLGLSVGARLSWGSWLSPTLQLTPLWGKTGTTGPAAALGDFSWAMARLEVCPLNLRLTPRLGFSPCVMGEVGRLAARGRAEGVSSASADRWWVAPGLTAALQLEGGRWFVRLGAEAVFPATRDEFVFRNPDLTVHQPRVFAYGARWGAGFRWGQ